MKSVGGIGARRAGKPIAALLVLLCSICTLFVGVTGSRAGATDSGNGRFEGVASCAGSTCHGRMEADGAVVRQDELMRWQEPSSQAGAHSRAYSILLGQRARQITATLGMGDPTSAPACLGCHATPTNGLTGARFRTSDGVGCEACHGPSSGWISTHFAVGGNHKDNVSRGLIPLENATTRAGVCLDCHLGSKRSGQFVTHRIMAAGHPRVTFEMDLFSTLQQHHNEDADYTARKGRTDSVRMWAVGQAMAVNRALTLYADAKIGTDGAFPEFYFLDCHSCHRRIFDQEDRVKTWEANPGRPIPAGMPPFNDENMILLSAAARVTNPALAARFDKDARAFHQAMAGSRATSVAAGVRLAATASDLASALSARSNDSDTAFAIVDSIAGPASAPRFTDYTGSVQAVMAIDSLLNALVKQGRVTIGAAAGIRADINRAYAAVKEPNGYRPPEFRGALASAVRSIRSLR